MRSERLRGSLEDWTLLFLEGVAAAMTRAIGTAAEDAACATRFAACRQSSRSWFSTILAIPFWNEGEKRRRSRAPMIRRAHELRPDPDMLRHHRQLGLGAQYKMGEYRRSAIETLGNAPSAQEPANAEIYEHYGDALYAAGYPDRSALRLGQVARYYASPKRMNGRAHRAARRQDCLCARAFQRRATEPVPRNARAGTGQAQPRAPCPQAAAMTAITTLKRIFAFCIDGDMDRPARAKRRARIGSTSTIKGPFADGLDVEG